jgi:hypothetical protein
MYLITCAFTFRITGDLAQAVMLLIFVLYALLFLDCACPVSDVSGSGESYHTLIQI